MHEYRVTCGFRMSLAHSHAVEYDVDCLIDTAMLKVITVCYLNATI